MRLPFAIYAMEGGADGRKIYDSQRRDRRAFARAVVESNHIFKIARGE